MPIYQEGVAFQPTLMTAVHRPRLWLDQIEGPQKGTKAKNNARHRGKCDARELAFQTATSYRQPTPDRLRSPLPRNHGVLG